MGWSRYTWGQSLGHRRPLGWGPIGREATVTRMRLRCSETRVLGETGRLFGPRRRRGRMRMGRDGPRGWAMSYANRRRWRRRGSGSRWASGILLRGMRRWRWPPLLLVHVVASRGLRVHRLWNTGRNAMALRLRGQHGWRRGPLSRMHWGSDVRTTRRSVTQQGANPRLRSLTWITRRRGWPVAR